MLPQAVSEHYRAQQRLIVSTLALTRREWSAMDPVDLETSWAKVGPRVNLLTTAGQLGAARNGAGYVAATLEEFGEDLTPAGLVNPRAFAGIASDGRPLDTLLDGALYRAKGMNLESGGKWLDMAVHTQIADASRGAASTAIASYDDVGWVRMVNPPCCGACAVLSGKEFRYNQGFQRHPRCDCVHIPSTLRNPADNMGVNPSLDQITDLTDAERKALAEGADLPQVINARRGRSRDKMSTTEGTARNRSRRRLTPDGIFAQAKSRDEALALLRQNGYLSEYGRAVPLTRPRIAKSALDPKWLQGRDVHIAKLQDAARHKAMAESYRSSIARFERDKAYFLEQIEERRKFILSEGLTERKVAAIMKKQSDVIGWRTMISGLDDNIASLQRQVDDVAERLARTNLPDFDPDNPLKFYGDRLKFLSDGDEAAIIARDLEKLPEVGHRVLQGHFAEVDGSGFRLGTRGAIYDIDEFSDLRGATTRNFSTYDRDSVLGVYRSGSRVCGCTTKNVIKDAKGRSGSSTILHEATHALDDALGSASKREFAAIWDDVDDRLNLWPYISKRGNPQHYLSEGFAESYSRFVKVRHETRLSGDRLVDAFADALRDGSGIGPKGKDAVRRLVAYFDDLESAMRAAATG